MTSTLKVSIDEYDTGVKIKTFEKTFKNEQAMYEWLGNKLGHPFLTYRISAINPVLDEDVKA